MAVSGVIVIPDKGKDVLLKNLSGKLLKAQNRETYEGINKDVINLSNSTIRTFMYLNNIGTIVNLGTEEQYAVSRYVEDIKCTSIRLLNVELFIPKDYDINFDKNIYERHIGLLRDIKPYNEEMFINTKTKALNRNFGIVMASLLLETNLIEERLISEVYQIPYGKGTLLIPIINEDNFQAIFNALVKVAVDYLQVTRTNLSLVYNLNIILTPFKAIVADLVKTRISKEPGIGNIIIDSQLNNVNKSYLLLPTIE